MNCGLLGRKLGHSYSPQIHASLGDYTYSLFEKEPQELQAFLGSDAFTGLNVTVPYKKAVIEYLDELSPRARRLGAVNTVVRRPDGSLIGHNTDYFGFACMVRQSGLSLAGKKVLVLGSGGASSTAVAVLEELGAQAVVISRSGENHYGNLSLHRDASMIVNTTPVGMYPNVGDSPVSPGLFPHLEGVLDVIYNPARTKLLLEAEQLGIPAMNGLLMLVAQAKESAEWFTGAAIPDRAIFDIHRRLKVQMENIVLIGMPGCGKSTVGAILAQKLGRAFVDVDREVETEAGCSIPDIFAKGGETAFRSLETKVVARLGKKSGLILATGGGCVTRKENYSSLHQNGTIFWLQRDLAHLPTDGRPLSQMNGPEALYAVRRPMYEAFSDAVIDNSRTAEAAADQIIRYLEERT